VLFYLQIIETNEDKTKFEEIYKTYRNLMYKIAYERLHNEQDSEDVVHSVFVKIAKNITSIDPVSARTKKLVIIMLENCVTDILRARSRHTFTDYNDEIPNCQLYTEMDIESLLTECILKLPEQQRTFIWLKYHFGYSTQEIAKILGISLFGAQKIDQRAKKSLQNSIGKVAARCDSSKVVVPVSRNILRYLCGTMCQRL